MDTMYKGFIFVRVKTNEMKLIIKSMNTKSLSDYTKHDNLCHLIFGITLHNHIVVYCTSYYLNQKSLIWLFGH